MSNLPYCHRSFSIDQERTIHEQSASNTAEHFLTKEQIALAEKMAGQRK